MPNLFEIFFQSLYTMPLPALAAWTLLENVIIFVVCLVVGHLLVLRYQRHPVTEPPPPLTFTEVFLALDCVFLNAVVTFVGALLWRANIIHIDFSLNPLRVLVDTVVLFVAMDLGMYVFHRLAHHPLLYPLLHRTHHRFENPRPLTLFVLNPFEVLGFGALWLMVLFLYPSNWLSVIFYLTLNIVFGLVGHLGVEPMPTRWIKIPFIHYVSTSTFHAEHHQDAGHNFGFYTLIWDRLFGTLSPDYETDFISARAGKAMDSEIS